MIKGKDGIAKHVGLTLTKGIEGGGWLYSDYGVGVYARVWNPEKFEEHSVLVGAHDVPGGGWTDEVIVDATDEVIAAAELKRSEENWAHSMIHDLKEELEVTTGKAVEVVKGRKVPKGTKGIVRWMGDGRWGMRVGLKVEGQDKLVYTALSNVEVDLSPEGREAQAQAQAEREAYKAKALKAAEGLSKGMTVKVTSGRDAGAVGVIFWMRDGRLGLKANPKDRTEQPVWANAAQVVAG
jgi:hypothetical protein